MSEGFFVKLYFGMVFLVGVWVLDGICMLATVLLRILCVWNRRYLCWSCLFPSFTLSYSLLPSQAIVQSFNFPSTHPSLKTTLYTISFNIRPFHSFILFAAHHTLSAHSALSMLILPRPRISPSLRLILTNSQQSPAPSRSPP